MTFSDPFGLHRLVLLPLFTEDPQQIATIITSEFTTIDEEQFLGFILQHGLGPLWHERLKKSEISYFSPCFTASLKEARLAAATNYMWQKNTIKRIDDIFSKESIPYAVFKGTHIREIIYSNPAIRPACDIDILVSKADRETSMKALVAAGYAFQPKAENISHEATLSAGRVSIDLHWDIMRPGRARRDIANELLATRKKFSGYWGLNDEATLLIMLVHPVFTKYLNSPDASLVRIVDLAHWVEQRQPDWDKVYLWLQQAGLCTAAWTMLEWLKILTEIIAPAEFIIKIHPGRIKARYLRFWLYHDYTNRFIATPMVNKVAFTLPVHDRLSDAIRATWALIGAKKSAAQTTKRLGNAMAESSSE